MVSSCGGVPSVEAEVETDLEDSLMVFDSRHEFGMSISQSESLITDLLSVYKEGRRVAPERP